MFVHHAGVHEKLLLLLLVSVSPRYFLLAAILLLSLCRFLLDLCIVHSSPTKSFDVVAVKFLSTFCASLYFSSCLGSSARLAFSANLHSFSAILRAFSLAIFFAFSAFSSAAFLAFSAFSANFFFLSSAFLCFSSSAFCFSLLFLVSFVVLLLLQLFSLLPFL